MMYRRPRTMGGAGLLSGALLAASSWLAPVAAQQAWTPSVETQAETAYKAIYARSLETARAGAKSARRNSAVETPLNTGAITPDLPVRRTAAPSEIIDVGNPPPGTAKSAPPNPPAAAFTQPLMRKPNALDDLLTTQVLSDDTEPAPAPIEPKPTPQTTGDQYCSNIANAASDARIAWQKKTLAETEKQVEKRVEELNGKIAEYQKWLARRDEFSRKAQSTITDIYAKMKPDAAAQQLTALDEETAAAVITKLSAKISSALMAEMDAKKAARLTAIISSSAKGPDGKPPAQPGGGT